MTSSPGPENGGPILKFRIRPLLRYLLVAAGLLGGLQAAGWLSIWKPASVTHQLEAEVVERTNGDTIEIRNREAADSLLSARISQLENTIHADLSSLIRLECVKTERRLTRTAGLSCSQE